MELAGTLERFVFQNQENFWSVARFRDDQDGQLHTVVGRMPGVSPGESLRLTGRWVMNPRFG